ncbi:MAG: AraC family transcriptional regulator [Roseivirga sp.]|nr:AraC family transcriptional regulator [Roseivirga sp.]
MLQINIIGLSILALFLLAIIRKKNKRQSDYALMSTILLIAGVFLSYMWVNEGVNLANLILQNLVSVYILPSFLVYAMLLIKGEMGIRKSWWWFGSIAITFTAFIIIDFIFLTDYGPDKIEGLAKSPPMIYRVFYRVNQGFSIISLIWFLKQLKEYDQKLKEQYSSIEPIRLGWLKTFTWLYLILSALTLVILLAYSFGIINDTGTNYFIVYGAMILSLFYLCYHGIRQYTIAEFYEKTERQKEDLKASEEPETSKPSLNGNQPKYSSSSLSEEAMKALYSQIEMLFEEEQIYLEPELKIRHIASELKVNSHNVSQTLNTVAGKSFYDYVNKYRVERFKELLSNPENRKFTILGLGLESGFNSKASLNRVFKQYIGVSPIEFQKQSS